jgi:microcystin synthetase protein McyJ
METNIEALYERVEKRQKNVSSKWLNLGYWEQTNCTEKACEMLFEKVIEQLNVSENANIFDAGFGYGIQDVFLLNKHPHVCITGYNIIQKQVDYANELINTKNLTNNIKLLHGNCVNTKLSSEQFDIVMAIESAFQFNTRELFFKEAYRLLKKDGQIVLADCLPSPSFEANDAFIKAGEKAGIPLSNQYNIDTYVEIMKNAGFVNINYIDITDFVLRGAVKEVYSNNGWRSGDALIQDINDEDINKLMIEFTHSTTIGKYYIIKANKN